MIKFDFSNTVLVDNNYQERKDEVINKFKSYDMIGWDHNIDINTIKRLIEKKEEIKSHSSLLLVIGIGGSYLGSKALYDMFNGYFDNDFEVLYAGHNLSSNYLNDLIDYINDKDFTINVISKSGNTLEVKLAYQYIKQYMEGIYSEEELRKRIIFTTGDSGYLYEEAIKYGYTTFSIPNDIGGRYSLMTDAHLFPLSFNIDIEKLIEGYNNCSVIEDAYQYASIRKSLYDNNKLIENYVSFEPKYQMFLEWLKQLFGESEGKDGVGIYPTSTIFTTDLHSLGQFIQEGNKILFETFIIVKNNDCIKINNNDLNDITYQVVGAVRTAHYKGNVSVNYIELDELNEYNIGSLIRFFFYSAAFSSILFGVNPFNQPGVEVYKEEVRNRLEVI